MTTDFVDFFFFGRLTVDTTHSVTTCKTMKRASVTVRVPATSANLGFERFQG
jgi:hypothetical protein